MCSWKTSIAGSSFKHSNIRRYLKCSTGKRKHQNNFSTKFTIEASLDCTMCVCVRAHARGPRCVIYTYKDFKLHKIYVCRWEQLHRTLVIYLKRNTRPMSLMRTRKCLELLMLSLRSSESDARNRRGSFLLLVRTPFDLTTNPPSVCIRYMLLSPISIIFFT